jgi:hypothetical protein
MPLNANETVTIDMGGAEYTLAIETLTGNTLRVDPGGAGADFLLPAEADCPGVTLVIFNTADAAEAITVKDDSDTTTVMVLDQGQSGVCHCDGSSWVGGSVAAST